VSWRPGGDNTTLASGSWDYTVQIWDVETGARLRTLRGHAHSVTSVAWHRGGDGTQLASGSWDHTVRIWGTDATSQ
jgi:WD40 repeat protein